MSAVSPFSVFYDAQQLHKYGMLQRLITQYPKFKTRQWGIPDELVTSYLIPGLINRLTYKHFKRIGGWVQSSSVELMHRQFSSAVARDLPPGTDILYGLSSFMLEAIQEAKSKDTLTIVYHGSLHERMNKKILQAECEEFGFAPFGNWQFEWLLERQDAEFAKTDLIIVGSNVVRNTMIEYGVLASKIFVNHRGADLSIFYPVKKEDSTFRIIFCGALNPHKGVHYLVRAFSELALPDAELWLIGLPPEDRRLKEILQKYANDNIVMKGTFPKKELKKIFCQGSLFVLPSLGDGFPAVVSQAMACGLPVIVTDMTGWADGVIDGQNGFTVRSRSVEMLKEKIHYMYKNPELCAAMGRNALETVKDGYNWDAYGERLLNLLNHVYNLKRK